MSATFSMTKKFFATEQLKVRFSMPTAYMCTATAASIILLTTGVVTSVSLFVLVALIVPFLFLGLVVLISILLTGLTGLVTLESLVGHEIERTVRTVEGD
jgi:hypothetical protein